jgi:hypothetical protein
MMAVADKRFAVVPGKVLSIPAIQVRNIHFPIYYNYISDCTSILQNAIKTALLLTFTLSEKAYSFRKVDSL